jgi:hypothetical protein
MIYPMLSRLSQAKVVHFEMATHLRNVLEASGTSYSLELKWDDVLALSNELRMIGEHMAADALAQDGAVLNKEKDD